MAVADMSPAHQDAVGAFLKSAQDMVGRYRGRAHDPYDPRVGRVLHPADAGQIRRTVGAPVAQESDDLGLKFR